MKKTTFFVTKSINNRAISHLFIVISDPNPNDEVLVVNVSTLRNPAKADPACIVNAGEHSAIKDKSFIFYYFAEKMTTKWIADKCRNNIYEMSEEISDSLLVKIQDGAKRSMFLKQEFKRFFSYF